MSTFKIAKQSLWDSIGSGAVAGDLLQTYSKSMATDALDGHINWSSEAN